MKLILIFTALVFCTGTLFSQVNQEWYAKYNGPGNGFENGAVKVAVDNSGNVYVTGSSDSLFNYDIVTVKYSPSGVQLWESRYSTPGDDFASSIAVDNSGNVYVIGSSDAHVSMQDYVTIKYNSSGVQQWASRYNGALYDNDNPFSLAIDASGNVYVTGGSAETSSNSNDYTTVKYNSAGVQQWVSSYNGTGSNVDFAAAIGVDIAGNVYITGTSFGGASKDDYATIKYNSSGVQQWVVRYNGTHNGNDRAQALVLDSRGNIYVTGSSNTSDTSSYTTIKYNSLGTQVWASSYRGTGEHGDNATGIVVDNAGNAYVTGRTSGDFSYDYATIKYGLSGEQLWAAIYDGTANMDDGANAIAIDNQGNIYVTGESTGLNTLGDYATLKYSPEGVQLWEKRFNDSDNLMDYANSIAVDNSGNVYVTGTTSDPSTITNYGTIKYSQQLTGIAGTENTVNDYKLLQNYPNPFNPSTVISFNIPERTFVRLNVYDVSGKLISSLVNQSFDAGSHSVQFNGANLSTGVYFYRLETGSFIQTNKMLLVK